MFLISRYGIFYILTKKRNISNISLLSFFYFMKSEQINIDGFN